jgi:hypothetical protein
MMRSVLICYLVVGISLFGIARAEDLASPPAEHAAALDNWDMSPYRVQIYVRIDAAPGWTAARRKVFVAEVANRAAGLVGGVWQIDAAEAPADLHWDHASALDHVALDAIPAAAIERDKVFLLGIEQSAGQAPSIWARELDVRTRLWSGVLAQPGSSLSASTADLAQDAVRAAWKSFRPLARIESIADQGATVRIRGGGLAAGNHATQLARPGSVWQPIIRHFDVAGKTVKDGVFPIAATWLRTGTIDGATAHCTLVTGVQDPLALEYDGRTEYLALAVTSQPSVGTAIVCLTHGPPERPLAGLDVLIRDTADHPPRLVGQTDSSGTFRLTSAASDVLTVYIRSGDDLLSRFPLVPGLDPTMTIRLDDTGRRPESARFVEAMRMELLDLATQQRLLATRFQHQVINGQLDDAAKTIATLQHLSTVEQFLKSLDESRAKMTTIADDPPASAWLDKRLEEIKTLAQKSLLSAQDLAKLDKVLAAMRRK